MTSQREQLRFERDRLGSWGRIAKSRLRAVKEHAGRRILDVGCSKGAYVESLRADGYFAYGCDLMPSPEWKNGSASPFCLGDLIQLPFPDNSFDTVIGFEVLEHIDNPALALGELMRVTRGNIIISVPNCQQSGIFELSGLAYHHWVDSTHKQFFSLDSLNRELEDAGFEVNLIKYINPISPDKLFLASWHLPTGLCNFLGNIGRKLPLRKRFFMTLLAVASKKVLS